MAPLHGTTGHAAWSYDWQWDSRHNQHYKWLHGGDGLQKCMWANGYKPVNDDTPEFGAIYTYPGSRDYCYERIDPPESSSSTSKLSTPNLTATAGPNRFVDRPKQAAYEVYWKPFPINWTTLPLPGAEREVLPSPHIAAHARYPQPKTLWRPPSAFYVQGYCDHLRCRDPYCIETQYKYQGFRDDLRHHEDQDKNGNMSDGDNAGSHSTVHETSDESDDSDDYAAE